MGQAKFRGNFEERKELAIARAQAIADYNYQMEMEREKKKQEEWEKLTPKEQEVRVKQAACLANVYSNYVQMGTMNKRR